jgi:hypothetical protein
MLSHQCGARWGRWSNTGGTKLRRRSSARPRSRGPSASAAVRGDAKPRQRWCRLRRRVEVSDPARNSPRTSTRFGRCPPGGVTQYTEPDGTDQSGSRLSRRPSASASRTMNSGKMPRPVPAMRAGIMASPLFTRSGPDGRTVAVFPFLCVKRQVSGVTVYA